MSSALDKRDLFTVFVVLFSLAAFLLFVALFQYADFGALAWGLAFALLLVWQVLVGFWMVFALKSQKAYWACLGIGASSLVFLLVNVWAALGAAALTGFLFWAFLSAKQELALLSEVRFFRVFQRSFSKSVWGIAILLAITYGVSIAQLLEERGELIPQPIIQAFAPRMSVGEFQEALNTTVLQVFQGEIMLVDGAPAEESLADFLHSLANERLQEIIQPWQGITPLFLVVGAFLILRILSIPFLWIALGVGMLCVRILFIMGRIGVVREKAVREEVVWSSEEKN